jgi:hypothetical protein
MRPRDYGGKTKKTDVRIPELYSFLAESRFEPAPLRVGICYERGIDMIGNTYKIFGTDTVFEITGQGKSYWVISIRSAKGEQLRVHIEKSALADGVREKKLAKLEGVDA